MSQLSKKDMHTPFNASGIAKIRGRMEKVVSKQTTAANLTESEVMDARGTLREISFVAQDAAAAGESMTLDVQVNGVSILPSVFTYDDTVAPGTVHQVTFNADTTIAVGDLVTWIRAYVAGGGPTPMGATKAVMEFA